jgi:endonuclease/exonuclease/phosphatase family metal-dependent hydrolase
VLVLAGTFVAAVSMKGQAQTYVKDTVPDLFTYDELLQLNRDPISATLAGKLKTVTTTPFVNNEAYLTGARPQPLTLPGLGPTLRVAFWNIERGLELDYIKLFLSDKDAFMDKVQQERQKANDKGTAIRKVDMDKIPEEIETLKAAEVWILNEVDWGVKRTEYREVIRELGQALNMNWAYGVEFVEVAPTQLGIDQFDDGETNEEHAQLLEEFKVDKEKLRALHGNAVLSRYPIRDARLVPFTVGYDWYKENKIRPLEKAKRKAALLVGEELLQELRRGQRTTLYVDLDVPEAPGGVVTVASTHLENRTKPKVRRKQMQELLNAVKEIKNPVVIAGDMNTTG